MPSSSSNQHSGELNRNKDQGWAPLRVMAGDEQMSLDDFILNLKFFMPSESLTKRIAILNAAFLNDSYGSDNKRVKHRRTRKQELRKNQRTIAERLYRSLAATSREYPGKRQRLVEYLCVGMPVMLGFPSFAEIDVTSENGRQAMEALNDLANEFDDWMASRGNAYQAPWGEIRIVRLYGNNYLELRPTSEPVAKWEEHFEDANEVIPAGMTLTTQ